jgi:hypothetical protein
VCDSSESSNLFKFPPEGNRTHFVYSFPQEPSCKLSNLTNRWSPGSYRLVLLLLSLILLIPTLLSTVLRYCDPQTREERNSRSPPCLLADIDTSSFCGDYRYCMSFLLRAVEIIDTNRDFVPETQPMRPIRTIIQTIK